MDVAYASGSRDKNRAVYLRFVGAREPKPYGDKLPAYQRIDIAGAWIGANILVPTYQSIKHWPEKASTRTTER